MAVTLWLCRYCLLLSYLPNILCFGHVYVCNFIFPITRPNSFFAYRQTPFDCRQDSLHTPLPSQAKKRIHGSVTNLYSHKRRRVSMISADLAREIESDHVHMKENVPTTVVSNMSTWSDNGIADNSTIGWPFHSITTQNIPSFNHHSSHKSY